MIEGAIKFGCPGGTGDIFDTGILEQLLKREIKDQNLIDLY